MTYATNNSKKILDVKQKTLPFLCGSFLSICFFVTPTTASATENFQGNLTAVSITDSDTTNQPPVALFSYTQDGNTFTFDASGSSDPDGEIVDYKWDFGNGIINNGITTNFETDSTNSFSVTLTIADNTGGVAIHQQLIQTKSEKSFYWSMDTLPSPTMTSDEGNVSISLYNNPALSVPGVSNNAMQQEGNHTSYFFPANILPTSKGKIEIYVKHDFAPNTSDATNRTIFRTSDEGKANSIYAYTYKNTIFFYLFDSSGNYHRAYKQADTWSVGVWHKYEFTWDSDSGYLGIKRDGTIVAESSSSSWSTPNWGTQSMYIGYTYPIGSFDELSITN